MAKKVVRRAPQRRQQPQRSKPKSDFPDLPIPLACIVYGPPGIGKTSWAAHFPNSVFIIDPHERGISNLIRYKQCPEPRSVIEVDSYEHLLAAFGELAEDDNIETVIGDSLTGFEKLCFIYHCKNYFATAEYPDGDWTREGFYAYQQGPKNAAKKDWPRLIDILTDLSTPKEDGGCGKNVVLLAHSTDKNFSNPDGPDYSRHVAYMDKETWSATHRWANLAMFYNFHVLTEKRGVKTKAKQQEIRNFYTQWTPSFDAKNQLGLEPVIDAGNSPKEAFHNFSEALRKLNY